MVESAWPSRFAERYALFAASRLPRIGSGCEGAGHRLSGLLTEVLSEDVLIDIRTHMQQERALGSPTVRSMVEKALNRPVVVGRKEGRVAIQTLMFSDPFWWAPLGEAYFTNTMSPVVGLR